MDTETDYSSLYKEEREVAAGLTMSRELAVDPRPPSIMVYNHQALLYGAVSPLLQNIKAYTLDTSSLGSHSVALGIKPILVRGDQNI